ncbi:MAG: hypothetical protein LE169_05670 [Endomicrobium sp.]|nr:hypothetical protein [Endomicrobium sp.]
MNAVVYAFILAGIVFSYALYRESTINQPPPVQPAPPSQFPPPQQPNPVPPPVQAPLNLAHPQNPPVPLNPSPNPNAGHPNPNPFIAQQPAPSPQDNPFANPQPNLFAPAQPAQAPHQNPFAQPAPPINLNPEPPPDLWSPNMPVGVMQGGIGASPLNPPPQFNPPQGNSNLPPHQANPDFVVPEPVPFRVLPKNEVLQPNENQSRGRGRGVRGNLN